MEAKQIIAKNNELFSYPTIKKESKNMKVFPNTDGLKIKPA